MRTRKGKGPRAQDLSLLESTCLTARAVSERLDFIKALLCKTDAPSAELAQVRGHVFVLESLLTQYGQALQSLCLEAGHV